MLKEIKHVIGLDVGGTSLKTAIVSSTGQIVKGSFGKIQINSEGPAQAIIESFINVLRRSLGIADKFGLNIIGIGIAVPAPFDFRKGVFLMRHKFTSLYGVNLKRALSTRLGTRKRFPIIFEHDSWAFLLGEAWLGAARDFNRVLGITIGTGLGSAFMVDNEIVIKGSGIPSYGLISVLPYKDGTVEDVISRRGLIARYRVLAKKRYVEGLDVDDLAYLAKRGDEDAIQVFKELGLNLAEVLKPLLSEFEADCLVLGGQISKSVSLFLKPLKTELRSLPSLKKITRAYSITSAPLYGVSRIIFEDLKSPSWYLRPKELERYINKLRPF